MSDPILRPARQSDRVDIVEFTTDTFSWGDYVGDSFDGWLAADESLLGVVEVDGRVAAIARAVLLSPSEAWLHAARVHPDHRRRGHASRLNDWLCGWAASQGAVVARLYIEDWNEAAQRQVSENRYRMVSQWVSARRRLGTEPDPTTNGGRRVRGEEQLTAATPAEVDPAWAVWSGSDMTRSGRGLHPFGWLFRRLTRDDIERAVRDRELLHGPSGWVMARDDNGTMVVPFVAAADDDLYRIVRAAVDRADRHEFGAMHVLVPDTPDVADALERAGFGLDRGQVWARPL